MDETTARSRWQEFLFPEPERSLPGERWLRTALRTLHIAAMAILVGGHFFQVPPERLHGPLAWTVLSGLALMLLELYGSVDWLFQIRGLLTILKLVLVGLVPMFLEQRTGILLIVIAIGSVGAHMPGRLRYYSVRKRRSGSHKKG